MKRIARDRCGYVGYVCNGIGDLKDAIKLNRMVCDTDITRVQFQDSYESETTPSFKYHLIDNYLNLPVSIEGFVTVPDIVQDMSGISWSPETECWSNDNDLDFLTVYGSLVVGKRDIDTSYTAVISNLYCFNPTYNNQKEITGGEERLFKPGPVEPALHVPMPSGPPAAIVSPNITLDGATLAIKNLFSWRCAIEDFITIYNPPMPDTCGIPQLLLSMNEESLCDNFKITHLNGVPIAVGEDSELDICTYEVSPGYVTVNGEKIQVDSGVFTAPFYAYVNITEDSTGAYHGALSTTSTGISVALGGVRLVDSTKSSYNCENESGGSSSSNQPTAYKMYAMEQNDCISIISTVDPVAIVDEVSPMICSLKDLIIGMNAETVCPNFKISLISGVPIVTGSSAVTLPPCYYSISSGTIYYGGTSYNVAGISTIKAPFYIYANLSEDKTIASLSTTRGNYAIGIGGVREVSTQQLDDHKEEGCQSSGEEGFIYCKAYVMEQDSCVEPVPLVTEEEIEELVAPSMCGIENLIIGLQTASVCPNFKIELISGTPLAYGESPILSACYYSVSAGTVEVAGEIKQVSGIASLMAPFYVYVNVPKDGTPPYLSTTRGDGAIGIGGVKEVNTKTQTAKSPTCEDDDDTTETSTSPYYRMYMLEQNDCVSTPAVDVTTKFCGIENLVIGINSETVCQNFKIKLISGRPLSYGLNASLDPCYYSVDDGTVTINGESIEVDGIDSIRAPFYIYLNISSDGSSATLSTTKGDTAIGIGGVRETSGASVTEPAESCGETEPGTMSQYKLFVIEQDDCVSMPITPVEHVSVCGIEELIVSLVSNTSCENLGITLKSGNPIVSWEDEGYSDDEEASEEPELPTCIYHVNSGTININGTAVAVEGADFTAPCYIYANISCDDKITAELSTSPAAKYIGIGGIRIVRSSDVVDPDEEVSEDCQNVPGIKKHMNYKMYAINQDDCATATLAIDNLEAGNVVWDPEADNPLQVEQDTPAPICGIRDLLVSMNTESSCEMFKISLISGCPMAYGTNAELDPCYYEVSDGQVAVNGIIHSVTGLSALRAPFDVYLNMTDTGSSIWLATSHGANYRWIGGVSAVHSDAVSETSKVSNECSKDDNSDNGDKYDAYSMYVIKQGDCSLTSLTPMTVDSVCSIEDLLVSLNKESVCENLKIEHKSGQPMVSWLEGMEEPELGENIYTVKAGYVSINNKKIHVDQTVDPEYEAPFYAYLHVYMDTSDDSLHASITNNAAEGTIAIGGVAAIKSDEDTPGSVANCDPIEGRKAQKTLYKMYAIEQAGCLDNVFYAGELEALIKNITTSTACEDLFKIHLMSGKPLVYLEDPDDPEKVAAWKLENCVYKIDGGQIEINGHEYTVEAATKTLNEQEQSVYWYVKLEVVPSGDSSCVPSKCGRKVTYKASLVTEKEDNCIGVGGVKYVKTNAYKMFVIEQQSCQVMQDFLRFDGKGVVWFDDSITTDAGMLSLGLGCGIETLLMAMNEETACEVFKIEHVSGKTIAFEDETLQTCYYRVSGGTITVNGASVSVAGGTFAAPFYAYINLNISQSSVTASISTSPSTECIGIGGVKLVDTDDVPTKPCKDDDDIKKATHYSMYVVEQGECITALEAVRTDDEGLLYRLGGAVLTPYSVKKITECDEE